MGRYLVKRALWAVTLLVAVSVITFVVFHVIPEDPGRLVAGEHAPASIVRRIDHQLGVDRPLYVQYARYVWSIVRHGSLGSTYESVQAGRGDSVRDLIARAAPVTVSLVLGGAVVWLAIALPLGVVAALRPGSPLDRGVLALVLLGISVHPIVIGTTLQYVFGYRLPLAPVEGYCALTGSGSCGGPVAWAEHLVLPWISFALLFVALYARMVRASVVDVLGESFVRTARSKGAGELRVLVRHVLRNALLPVVTMLGMDLGLAIGNAIYIEKVFHLPGLGMLVYTNLIRVYGYDLPVIAGVVLTASVAVILFNLVVDLVYAWVDPRIQRAD